MKFIDIFNLSTRMFKARTSRTFLTILGMSVGIGAILFLVSLGYGLQNTLLEKITTSDSILTLDVVPEKNSDFKLDAKTLEEIKSINGVSEISPAYELAARISMDNLSSDLSALVAPGSFLKLSGKKITSGYLMKDDKPEGIVVSSPVAKIFNKSEKDLLGSWVYLSFFEEKENPQGKNSGKKIRDEYRPENKFEIVGIVEGDENIVYVNPLPLSAIEIPFYSQLKVKCQRNEVMAGVREAISQKGFSVSSLSETVDQTNKIFRVIKIILMLFGFIALIVSAIGMFNTMTITLLERTEEIGIMKSIGASDGNISTMFVMESTIMGFLGGLLGIIIGWLEGNIFNLVVNLVAVHFGGQKVNLFYSPFWFVILVIAFSAIVGFATGIVPARRASRIDPLEALRYK